MEFRIFVKNKDKYEDRLVVPEANSGEKFFRSLILLIEEQLILIRRHIESFFEDKNKVHLTKPVHDDWETQGRIDKLTRIRKVNLVTKEKLKELLQDISFIICECGSKMYRTPLNTPFKRFGNSYLINSKHHGIRYTFSCESCFRTLHEEDYNYLQQNKERREKLLEEGYNWVPSDFNSWSYYDNGKPSKKSPELEKDDNEPSYTWERKFEYLPATETSPVKVKIIDICKETGKVVEIKLK